MGKGGDVNATAYGITKVKFFLLNVLPERYFEFSWQTVAFDD